MDRRSFPPLDGDFAQALLRSAEADEPSHAAYAKAASALGVGVGLGVGASLAAPALVASVAARWSGSALARLAAFGTSGALLVGGGAFLLSGRSPELANAARRASVTSVAAAGTSLARPAPRVAFGSGVAAVSASTAAPEALPARLSGRAAGSEGALIAAPAVAALAPSAASAGARRQAHAAGSPSHGASSWASGPSAPGSSLAEQVQSLDRARVALGYGNAGAALSEIAHYRKSWPNGVFLTEASVLEIEALSARGERWRAASLASAFVAAHPDSPQAEHLRALISADKR